MVTMINLSLFGSENRLIESGPRSQGDRDMRTCRRVCVIKLMKLNKAILIKL